MERRGRSGSNCPRLVRYRFPWQQNTILIVLSKVKKRTALPSFMFLVLPVVYYYPPPYMIFSGNAPKSDENVTVLWHKVLMKRSYRNLFSF